MIALLLASQAMAQDCTILRGAEVWMEGQRLEADVVIDGRNIAAVGEQGISGLDWTAGTWRGKDCRKLDVDGLVTPGLTETVSRLGLVEVSLEERSVDSSLEDADRPVRAALDVADAYNPRSSVIAVSRIEGITSAVISPGGGQISGRAAWVDLAGETQAEAVVKAPLALVANLSGESRAEALDVLKEYLADVRLYARSRSAFDAGRLRETIASRRDLEAGIPVVEGKIPLVVGADRASDIEALLRLADEQGIRLIIEGGAEAWIVARQLAEAEVPVIVDPLTYGVTSFDSLHARADNAALLSQAGVPVILSSFGTHNMRTLRQVAGNAVREGLDWNAALAAVTTTPAGAFGIGDHGRIAPGQVANLVVWKGAADDLANTHDPFDASTGVAHLFIGGEEIPLRSRQTELFERYRTLPGTPTTPLSVPEAP